MKHVGHQVVGFAGAHVLADVGHGVEIKGVVAAVGQDDVHGHGAGRVRARSRLGNAALTVGALVRPVGDDLRNAFFRVAEITRNGWARCYCVAYADGVRTTPEGRSRPKFRTRTLAVVDVLPSAPLPFFGHFEHRGFPDGAASVAADGRVGA